MERKRFATLRFYSFPFVAIAFAPIVLIMVLFVIIAITGEWYAIQRYGLFLAAWAVAGVLWARPVFRLVQAVEVEPRQLVFYRLFASSVVVPAGSVRAAEKSKRNPAAISIRHAGGSVTMPLKFRGLREVVEAIRLQNPSSDLSAFELLQRDA